jgi:hypothetical protein
MSVTEQKKPIPGHLITGTALNQLPPERYDWIVSGVLRTGRVRISGLFSRPHCGKSTLSKQLALAVAGGTSFLGRHCKQGRVLLWQCEDDQHDVLEVLKRMKASDAALDQITIFRGSPQENTLDRIAEELARQPYSLFIGETLDDVLRIPDLNSNTKSREAFERFEKTVLRPHYRQTSFFFLHHMRKRGEMDESGSMIMGATVVEGKTDSCLYLTRRGPQRFIHSDLRLGEQIERTLLNFNPETLLASLGDTVEASNHRENSKIVERMKAQIITTIQHHPEFTKREILGLVDGNSDQKKTVFKTLERERAIVASGDAVKGSPATYMVVDPAIRAEFLGFNEGVIQ